MPRVGRNEGTDYRTLAGEAFPRTECQLWGKNSFTKCTFYAYIYLDIWRQMSVILPDICLKWRRLPFSQRNVGRTLPDEWCCAMHPDPNCNRFVPIFILFTFFSPLLLVRLLSSYYVEMRVDIPAVFLWVWCTLHGKMKNSRLNGWIAWKTKLNLRSHFWTDKNLHGSAFRIHGTRGTMQVFEVTAKCACFCPD